MLVELKLSFGSIFRSNFEGRNEDKGGRIACPQTWERLRDLDLSRKTNNNHWHEAIWVPWLRVVQAIEARRPFVCLPGPATTIESGLIFKISQNFVPLLFYYAKHLQEFWGFRWDLVFFSPNVTVLVFLTFWQLDGFQRRAPAYSIKSVHPHSGHPPIRDTRLSDYPLY